MNRNQIEKLNEIGTQIANEIKTVTGATVEVTLRKEMMIYTEELDKIEEIKELVNETAEYKKESLYEADEDMEAGITLFYTY